VLTWFIFVKQSSEDGLLSIRLDLNGQVDQPLKKRSPAEINALQLHCKTLLILPSEWCSLLELALPWLADRKAREALPFALEDHLAQPVTQLHFAFDRAYYQNNSYLVVTIQKQRLQEWMQRFKEWGISYDAITLDWFALSPGEACVLENGVLVSSADFNGAVSFDVWQVFPHDWAKQLHWITCQDSAESEPMSMMTSYAGSTYQWLAERLFANKYINLCQGEFQHDTRATQVKRWYRLSGMLAGIWFVCFLGLHAGLLFMMSYKNSKLDKEIANVYHVFFPEARQVVSPKTRVMQLLQKNQTGHDAVLWTLIAKLSMVLAQQHPLTVVQTLQFQNQVVTATLICTSFSILEKIEAQLQQSHLHVHQLSAATEAQQVVAKLELSL